MEISELEQRLPPFCRAKYERPDVSVHSVHAMPGHAGFAYGFTVDIPGAPSESWFLRLPPPNVKWRGTADVLRQVAVLNALDATDVPHCSIKWSGDDLQWFERPYFVVPKLTGDVLRLAPEEWGAGLNDDQRLDLGKQIMTALAGIHRVDPTTAPYLGEGVELHDDVARWDTFYERAADPEKLALAPQVRKRLLETIPTGAPTGIFHGDFQTANLFCSFDAQLLAVIDWELVGIGATLNDVGWICTFSDRAAWDPDSRGAAPMFLDPDTLVDLYVAAWGERPIGLEWFRALAAYKFGIITGFNLSLHRRGKRIDDTWETTALSMQPLMRRALDLLG